MAIQRFELDKANDLDKQKLPIQTVNGVSPDSGGNISITSVSGNAGTATKLATARTISLTGDATGSASFDGSANKSIAVTLASSGVTAGTYNNVTVDAKGRVTAGSNVTIPATPKAYVTTTYRSGTEWYRVWSDGWIEQGGKMSASEGYTEQTVTFKKAFTSTNYSVFKANSTSNSGGDRVWLSGFGVLSKSTTNFTHRYHYGGACTMDWYACGY